MSDVNGVADQDVDAYLEAISRADRAAALDVVRGLMERGRSPLGILRTVIGPAQHRVGELWARDAWSVAQEHAATAVSEAVVSVLGAHSPPPPEGAPHVLVSCIEQEWHALPAMLVAEALRIEGLRVSYLGANAAPEHLVRHTLDTGPRAVLLSCSLSASLPRVRRHIEAIRETGTPVVVGGAAFDAEGMRARALGATASAIDGAQAALVIASLPSAVTPASPLTHPGALQAAAVYSNREVLAEQVSARLSTGGDTESPGWRRTLQDQLPYLFGAVAGGLLTGDSRVLAESLSWAGHVLGHRGAPEEVLTGLRPAMAEELADWPAAVALLHES